MRIHCKNYIVLANFGRILLFFKVNLKREDHLDVDEMVDVYLVELDFHFNLKLVRSEENLYNFGVWVDLAVIVVVDYVINLVKNIQT